jgi:hypothetical protein
LLESLRRRKGGTTPTVVASIQPRRDDTSSARHSTSATDTQTAEIHRGTEDEVIEAFREGFDEY